MAGQPTNTSLTTVGITFGQTNREPRLPDGRPLRLGLAVDPDLVVRRRHCPDSLRTRWRLRQRRLRHLPRGRREQRQDLTAAQITANNTTPSVVSGAINRPGVIYRVDPATGKTNVFFDLNTVISQIDATKGTTAANSLGNSTGLVNWYDITFDPEGYFDGKPSMFVTSVDASDPNKNAIYQIGADGTFMGMFVDFSAGRPRASSRSIPARSWSPLPKTSRSSAA